MDADRVVWRQRYLLNDSFLVFYHFRMDSIYTQQINHILRLISFVGWTVTYFFSLLTHAQHPLRFRLLLLKFNQKKIPLKQRLGILFTSGIFLSNDFFKRTFFFHLFFSLFWGFFPLNFMNNAHWLCYTFFLVARFKIE